MYNIYAASKQQTEMFYKKDPLFLNQVQYCEENLVPYMVVVGTEENDKGGVKIRNVVIKQEVCLSASNTDDSYVIIFFRTLSSMKLLLRK